MKINARELNDHLRRGLKPIYWISGDEIFFVNQTVKTILNAAKDQGFTEIERIPVNAQFHPERLYIETHDLSLFAKKRCLILDLENTLPSAKFTTALNALLKTSDPDLLLIIQSPKLTYSITQQEWFKTFDRIGIHIPIWPIASNQLPEWVRAQAQHYDCHIDMDAALLLAERTEGNLFATDQALEKLSLLCPSKHIQFKDVDALLENMAQFDVFDLMAAILMGDVERSWKVFSALKKNQIEPSILVWALAKEMRLLIQLHEGQSQTPLATLFKQHQIWEKRQYEIKQALFRLEINHCYRALQKLALLDRIIKGAASGNAWEGLSDLILELSRGEAFLPANP